MTQTDQPGRPHAGEFVVGGVRLPRPFQLRRLGHFGFNVRNMPACLDFYQRLLGFRISDETDVYPSAPPALRAELGGTIGYFLRHGTDHHSLALLPGPAIGHRSGRDTAGITTNQITWQVGSLNEVVNGCAWLRDQGITIYRAGRDIPGSNWHVYPVGPEGHNNELYYGIEQIGWAGLSKPQEMTRITDVSRHPPLPHRSERDELQAARELGIDLTSGRLSREVAEEQYDVGGVLLARPFKVVRIGPVRLFAADMDVALAFYRNVLGLKITEETKWRGHRCVFLRANTEHHSLALYPAALRQELDLDQNKTLLSFGLQVADYSQLRAARDFLRANGAVIKYPPAELFPGTDYSFCAIDPDGHAVQLYCYMEQIGWDGLPRPAEQRPKVDPANWPDAVNAHSDTFQGEPFLGPLG